MAEFSTFKGSWRLTLTLDRVILHTLMHHSSTSTYVPNFMEIEETFCGRRTDGHLWPTLLGRLGGVDLKRKKLPQAEHIARGTSMPRGLKNQLQLLATLTYKALASGSPAYLSSLLTPYDPVCTLRSSDQLLLQRFSTSTKTNFGSRAFRSAAPSVWNLLPCPVRASATPSSCKRALKSHYFQPSLH